VVTSTIAGVAIASDLNVAGNIDLLGHAAKRPAPQPDKDHPGQPADRTQAVSRSADRVTMTAKPLQVTGHRFTTVPLNVRGGPGQRFRVLTALPTGARVPITGETQDGWAQVLLDGQARWVAAPYLSATKPEPTPTSTPSPSHSPKHARTPSPSPSMSPSPSVQPVVSHAVCSSGSSVESGITANADTLHRSVCAHFPQVKVYGGYRADGSEHQTGRALDMMVYSDSGLGQQIADWVRANHAALHVVEVIWAQHIWTTERSSEGWRLMADRGSRTANHYDHVHVLVS
jgi:hypothetical protein